MMKCSKIPQEPSHANGTNDEAKKNGDSAQDQKSMTISDFMEHLERLQGVSNVASRLSELLREQINSLSHTIPIQRGHEMVWYSTSLLVAS